MISINLLSDAKKKELTYRKIYLFTKNLTIIVSIVLIFASILLYFANSILIETFEQTSINSQFSTASGNALAGDFENLGAFFKDMNAMQDKFIYYDSLMEDITKLIPDGIALHDLEISLSEKSAIFRGYAPSRNILLLFKDNLENSKIFDHIESPLSNLLEKENIEFKISANLMYENPK